MKRIAFVTGLTLWSMGKGNGGPAFTQTVRKYIQMGWEVYIISDVMSNAEYSEVDKEHNIIISPSWAKKYIGIRKIGCLFRWIDHLNATRKFSTIIKQLHQNQKLDLVYAYEIFGVRACRKFANEISCPLVTRFQGTILSEVKINFVNRIKRYPHFHALEAKADLTIMTDDGTKGLEVLRNLKTESREILFLRNGLDLMKNDIDEMYANFDREAFRSKIGVKNDDIMFLTVSRLVSWKKVERAIDGVANLSKIRKNIKLVIVGDGDAREQLGKIVREKNVEEYVHFVGAVPHDDVYEFMMACDVFLSLYDLSNVGNPLLEAMALGKAIITLDVGDTKKIINGNNGILLKKEELSTLCDFMEELINDSEKKHLLEKNAYVYAKNNFYSWDERMNIEYAHVEKLFDK